MYRNAVITSWDLSTNPEKSFSMSVDDIVLTDTIDEYYLDELQPNGVEIFEQRGNIIVTDTGYYGAFYDDELSEENE